MTHVAIHMDCTMYQLFMEIFISIDDTFDKIIWKVRPHYKHRLHINMQINKTKKYSSMLNAGES